jgi:hypothetical protein
MSILDLQGLASATTPTKAGNSGASKGCFTGGNTTKQSNVSFLCIVDVL